MKIELFIISKDAVYDVSYLCSDSITLTRRRTGSPSVLSFKIVRDLASKSGVSFHLGDNVKLIVDGKNVFSGFIFSKDRDSEQIISATAYDQLRYLKNKDTITLENKKASDALKEIASIYMLNTGMIEDTGFIVPRYVFYNQTLFDIILYYIDMTYQNTGKKFVLYDDFGELTLKNAENMKLNLLLASDDSYLINFNYKNDIDSDTYNNIKLLMPTNVKKGEEKEYKPVLTKSDETIEKWGILQYLEVVDEELNEAQIKNMADNILKEKNKEKKTLSVECFGAGIGEIDIRGGSCILIKIDNLGEENFNNWVIVEECTHIFSNNEHLIKLEVSEV